MRTPIFTLPAAKSWVSFWAGLAVLLAQVPARAAAPETADAFTEALTKGPFYAALAALAGGFLVSLTPCVYPMIAVTVSVFGARSAKSRRESAFLSGAFVLGMIAMFVPLGVVAGLTGSLFGAVLQNRWVVAGMACLFVALAAGMFGAFELTLPASVNNRLATLGGIGYKGAFLLGAACGLIASPCTGPVLTGILTFIAKTRSAGLGALAMATFALGLGLPFFAVGTFAIQLPKSGRWMIHIKSVLGIILVVVALYFLSTAFPSLAGWVALAPSLWLVLPALVVAGLVLGAIQRDFAAPGLSNKLAKTAGVSLLSAAFFLAIVMLSKPVESVTWERELPAARARARAENKPLLVDFTAAWCGACKELDRVTFAAGEVRDELARFVTVKIDATNDEDPKVAAVLRELEVVGLPTVILFDTRGAEVKRYNDFVKPQFFLEGLRAAN